MGDVVEARVRVVLLGLANVGEVGDDTEGEDTDTSDDELGEPTRRGLCEPGDCDCGDEGSVNGTGFFCKGEEGGVCSLSLSVAVIVGLLSLLSLALLSLLSLVSVSLISLSFLLLFSPFCFVSLVSLLTRALPKSNFESTTLVFGLLGGECVGL